MRKIQQLIFVVALLMIPGLILAAEEAAVAEAPAHHPAFYVGLNPLALSQFLGYNVGPFASFFGVFCGSESGVALYAGWEFSPAQALEARLSTGPTNQALWETQAQVGYLWYPFETFFNWNSGPCAGVFLRNIAFANTLTDVWVFSLVPELVVGWRFWIGPVAIDLRGGWNFCALSWSTMPHTSAGLDWITMPNGLNFSAGVGIGL